MEPPNPWLKVKRLTVQRVFVEPAWVNMLLDLFKIQIHKSLRNDPALSYLRLFTQKTYLVNNQSEKIYPGLLRLQSLKTCTGSHVGTSVGCPKMTGLSDIRYPFCRERRGLPPAAESPGQPASPQFLGFVPHNPVLSNENKVKKQLWQTSNIQ